MKYIELLSPAKNLENGKAAILHGADAVYIGAELFGARAAAGNSLDDIKALVDFARPYFAKVYVAMNTVLTDQQLEEAGKQIWKLYEIGVDAIIIQDMGILRMDLPPIQIHASTQTDNRDVQKSRFLKEAGFSRVVLARESSLNQIREIHDAVDVELEVFVHGALCVSYSGQCYISQSQCGRSANRGECAQFCRLPYQMYDSEGQLIAKNKHLLSLKDLDLSDHLEELMDAGVLSLKIEGRMKNLEYAKNVTGYYSQKLDEILKNRTDFRRASSGKTTLFFEPQPDKTFRRSSTDYFLLGRHDSNFDPDTPKSLGEPLGKIKSINRFSFSLDSDIIINNGDGICFKNKNNELTGFQVNTVTNGEIFPSQMPELTVGTFLYRNQDRVFSKTLQGDTSKRLIDIQLCMKETENGFMLELTDENEIVSSVNFETSKELAQNKEKATENIIRQLIKSGNTIYSVSDVSLELQNSYFFPASVLNEWRRTALENHTNLRVQSYKRELRGTENRKFEFGEKKLSYLGNVTNRLAREFYLDHGVEEIMPGFEIQASKGVPVMFTKHCIKFEMGWCPKKGNKHAYKEPFYLENNGVRYGLEFDCKNCMMKVMSAE